MQNRRVAVRGIILDGDKLLCVRLKKLQGAVSDDGLDYWCTPGGGVDIGEPLTLALERELVEELGVKPEIGKLLYIQQFEHNSTEHLEFFFHIINAQDYKNTDLSTTTHGAIEIAEVGFINSAENTLLPTFLTQQNLALDAASGHTNLFNYING